MKAFITSIGEPTTRLCKWSLERNGFDVYVVDKDGTLAQKLKLIYELADDDFIRVDADVIPNSLITPEYLNTLDDPFIWWYQFQTFDWYKQDITHGGIQFIKKEALPALSRNISTFLTAERPESQMYRLDEFENPRRGITVDKVAGIHGYGIKDISEVKRTKARRKQTGYDWELVEGLNTL